MCVASEGCFKPAKMYSIVDSIIYGSAAFAVFWVLRAFYRLSPFHPLAKIPGPRLAALTTWYEFYWNVIQDGQFTYVFDYISLKILDHSKKQKSVD